MAKKHTTNPYQLDMFSIVAQAVEESYTPAPAPTPTLIKIEPLFPQEPVHALALDEKGKELPPLDTKEVIEEAKRILTEHTPKRKLGILERNAKAILCLYDLERKNLKASAEEIEILKEYGSYGRISQVFEKSHKDYDNVKSLLQPADYAAARAATPNSFYTQREVAAAMWTTLAELGFNGGSVLDPSMATGNFFDAMPAEMRKKSKLNGIDLDILAGRIGAQIHQDAKVQLCGLQEAEVYNEYYDVTITNVPFGDYPVFDKSIPKNLTSSIHNYFILKMARLTRKGGLVAVITSRYTMDARSTDVREAMAGNLELLASVRLPTNAFKDFAGCEVITDILIFRKRHELPEVVPSWVNTQSVAMEGPRGEETFYINQEMLPGKSTLLGEYKVETGPYAAKLELNSTSSLPLHEIIEANLLEQVRYYQERTEELAYKPFEGKRTTILDNVDMPEGIKEGTYFVCKGFVFQKVQGEAVPVLRNTDRTKALIDLAPYAYRVLDLNKEGTSEELERAQRELSVKYDSFIENWQWINSTENRRAFKNDSRLPFLCALERPGEEGEFSKAAIFTQKVVGSVSYPEHVDDPRDAIILSIVRYAKLDWTYIEKITGKSSEQIKNETYGFIYLDPENDEWVPANLYLSGDVRRKLAQAKERVEGNALFAKNIEELEKVIPTWVSSEDIFTSLGATWIPLKYINQFVLELMDRKSTINDPSRTEPYDYNYVMERVRNPPRVNYYKESGIWNIVNGLEYGPLATVTWGTSDFNLTELLTLLLNNRQIQVFKTIKNEAGDDIRVVDTEATIVSKAKADAIQTEFRAWLWKEKDRCEDLEKIYNTIFNSIVKTKYDGALLDFPGLNPSIKPRPNQQDAILRAFVDSWLIEWQKVGFGKTLIYIIITMELKRLGLRNKAMHAVLNSTVEDYAAEFLRAYPAANILVISSDDMSPKERQGAMLRIATDNWDAVIIPHTSFDRIPIDNEIVEQFHELRMDEIEATLKAMEGNGTDKRTVKAIEKKRFRLEEKYKELLAKIKEDEGMICWSKLGIDLLIIDELHLYKGLFIETSNPNIAGVQGSESARSYNLFMKMQWLMRRCENGHILGNKKECWCGAARVKNASVIGGTGTLLSNSVSEMYTWMRFFMMDRLIDLNMCHFDAWKAQFGKDQDFVEMKPSGKGWHTKTRFARFYNVPELMAIFGTVTEIQFDASVNGIILPRVTYVPVDVEPSDDMLEYIETLSVRAKNLKGGKNGRDNTLVILGDALKAATDMRLVRGGLVSEINNKISIAIQNVYNIWAETKEVELEGVEGKHNLAQIIFLNVGVPGGDCLNLYEDMKRRWMQMGIPESEIAFAHDADKPHEKKEMWRKVNAGTIRVLIGSDGKMGAGVNCQRLLCAKHQIDAPWNPTGIEQSDGRIIRQGNLNKSVKIYRYVTKKSLDFHRWHLIHIKQEAYQQLTAGVCTARTIGDIGEQTFSFEQMKAFATGDPRIQQQVGLNAEVKVLGALKMQFEKGKSKSSSAINTLPAQIKRIQLARQLNIEMIPVFEEMAQIEDLPITLNDESYEKPEELNQAFMTQMMELEAKRLEFASVKVDKVTFMVIFDRYDRKFRADMYLGQTQVPIERMELSTSASGNLTRMRNEIKRMPHTIEENLKRMEKNERTYEIELEEAHHRMSLEFPQMKEYLEKKAELEKLEAEIYADELKANKDIVITE